MYERSVPVYWLFAKSVFNGQSDFTVSSFSDQPHTVVLEKKDQGHRLHTITLINVCTPD